MTEKRANELADIEPPRSVVRISDFLRDLTQSGMPRFEPMTLSLGKGFTPIAPSDFPNRGFLQSFSLLTRHYAVQAQDLESFAFWLSRWSDKYREIEVIEDPTVYDERPAEGKRTEAQSAFAPVAEPATDPPKTAKIDVATLVARSEPGLKGLGPSTPIITATREMAYRETLVLGAGTAPTVSDQASSPELTSLFSPSAGRIATRPSSGSVDRTGSAAPRHRSFTAQSPGIASPLLLVPPFEPSTLLSDSIGPSRPSTTVEIPSVIFQTRESEDRSGSLKDLPLRQRSAPDLAQTSSSRARNPELVTSLSGSNPAFTPRRGRDTRPLQAHSVEPALDGERSTPSKDEIVETTAPRDRTERPLKAGSARSFPKFGPVLGVGAFSITSPGSTDAPEHEINETANGATTENGIPSKLPPRNETGNFFPQSPASIASRLLSSGIGSRQKGSPRSFPSVGSVIGSGAQAWILNSLHPPFSHKPSVRSPGRLDAGHPLPTAEATPNLATQTPVPPAGMPSASFAPAEGKAGEATAREKTPLPESWISGLRAGRFGRSASPFGLALPARGVLAGAPSVSPAEGFWTTADPAPALLSRSEFQPTQSRLSSTTEPEWVPVPKEKTSTSAALRAELAGRSERSLITAHAARAFVVRGTLGRAVERRRAFGQASAPDALFSPTVRKIVSQPEAKEGTLFVGEERHGQITLVAPPMTVASAQSERAGSAVQLDWSGLANRAGQLDEGGLARLVETLPSGAQAIYPALPAGPGRANLRLAPRLLGGFLEKGYGAAVAQQADRIASKVRAPIASTEAARASLVPAGRPMGQDAKAGLIGKPGAIAEAGSAQAARGGAFDFLGLPVRLAPSLGGRPELRRQQTVQAATEAVAEGRPVRPEVFASLQKKLFPGLGSVSVEPDAKKWRQAGPSYGLRGDDPTTILAGDATDRQSPALHRSALVKRLLGTTSPSAATPGWVQAFAERDASSPMPNASQPMGHAIGMSKGQIATEQTRAIMPRPSGLRGRLPSAAGLGNPLPAASTFSSPWINASLGPVAAGRTIETALTDRLDAPRRSVSPVILGRRSLEFSSPRARTERIGRLVSAPAIESPSIEPIGPEFEVSRRTPLINPNRSFPPVSSPLASGPGVSPWAKRSAPGPSFVPRTTPLAPKERSSIRIAGGSRPRWEGTSPQMLYAPSKPRPAEPPIAIQRLETGAAVGSRPSATKSIEKPRNDAKPREGGEAAEINSLASEVWSLLRRRLANEAERRGRF